MLGVGLLQVLDDVALVVALAKEVEQAHSFAAPLAVFVALNKAWFLGHAREGRDKGFDGPAVGDLREQLPS